MFCSAEAAAKLALRDGKPEALGFYLDNRRVHVGDLSTLTEQVFVAWQLDRCKGLDSIMLPQQATSSANSTSEPALIGWPTPRPPPTPKLWTLKPATAYKQCVR